MHTQLSLAFAAAHAGGRSSDVVSATCAATRAGLDNEGMPDDIAEVRCGTFCGGSR